MRNARIAPQRARRSGEEGVALPLALLGLVLVSLLITAALVAASTESAMSGAHQDGTVALYQADQVIERWVSDKAASERALLLSGGQSALAPGLSVMTLAGTTRTVAVARLAQGEAVQTGTILSRTEVYSVLSDTSSRGRVIGALFDAVASINTAETAFNINAGAVSGGDLKINGAKATVSNRSESCADTAKYAVQVTKGSTVSATKPENIIGNVDNSTIEKKDLMKSVLGSDTMTLKKLADSYATIRFAEKNITLNGISSSNSLSGRDANKNWGCPAGMGLTCSPADTSRYPVIAIDPGGGTASLNGDYGQGTLIVYNGSLKIAGGFRFRGVILVEQDLDVQAANGGDGKIEGAVVAFGVGTVAEDKIGGNAKIAFNKCALDAAARARNLQALEFAPRSITRPTYGWFELVR
jgi:hypothetical protein